MAATRDEQCLQLPGSLLRGLTGGAVQVVNDAELMVPAAGYFDGIGVVAGTGSIAVARDAPRPRCWPPAAGAGSSATRAARPHLVREAAKAIRGALDARRRTAIR